jgi:hypothetical protein
MKKFVKITLKIEGGNHLNKWVDIDTISELSQNSDVQWPNNEGTIIFTDGAFVDIIGFNETLESLK